MVICNHLMKRRGFFPAVFFYFTALGSILSLHGQEPLTFCSYNLKNWLQMERSLDDGETVLTAKPEKEKAKVIEFIKSIRPDILGVCEIGSMTDLKEVQARLQKEGLHFPHLEHCTGGDATRSLGLLSRFPITARNSQNRLQYHIGEDIFLMQRGILDVTIAPNSNDQIRFLGVHLKSKRVIPEADEALMRRNEAHLLRRHLDTLFSRNPQEKIVCYGDFNEHRNEPAISEIIGSRSSPSYMLDLHLKDDHGLVWTHFWDDADVYGRLDYLFVSRALRPWVDSKGTYIFASPDFLDASDHRPVVMTIKPRPTPALQSQP